MRQRILVLIIALLLVSVASAIAVLASMSRQATIKSLNEQQDALTKFAVVTVELGVSTGQLDVVQQFLMVLSSNPLFAGAVLYDSDLDAILRVPDDFELAPDVEEQVLDTGSATEGQLAYQAAVLTDDAGEMVGYFLLGVSFESINREARRALIVTSLIGLVILLPVTTLIAWLLAWMEKRLRAREMRLAEVNKEIEIMLNNLEEGVFTFNTDCSINAQHSLRARQLFGVTDFKGSTFSQVFNADADVMREFQSWLAMISMPRIIEKWNQFEPLNPIPEMYSSVEGNKQIITLRYRPIVEGGALRRVMVLAADVTHQREAEEELAKSEKEREAEMGRVLSLVQNERSLLDGFLNEAKQCLEMLDAVDSPDDLADNGRKLYRDLHTLKGNSGSFGFTELAVIAHDLEDMVSYFRANKGAVTPDIWNTASTPLRAELDRISAIRSKLFSGGRHSMAVDRRAYEALVGEINSGGLSDLRAVGRRLWELDAMPFGRFCERYQRIVDQYRRRRGKNVADLHIETPDALIHLTLTDAFDDCIVHLVRNSLDHGIESDEVRATQDKGPGTIRIAFELIGQTARVTIADNGRGIDADSVAHAAVARGLVLEADAEALSGQERLDLVFRQGLSTLEDVSEISGRGVGMDAVKAYMERLGGSVTLDSRVGEGLTVVLTVPVLVAPDAATEA